MNTELPDIEIPGALTTPALLIYVNTVPVLFSHCVKSPVIVPALAFEFLKEYL